MKTIIAVLLILFVLSLNAQDDLAITIHDDEVKSVAGARQQTEDHAILKPSWELPKYKDSYSYLGAKPWLEASNVIEGYISLQSKREVDSQDTYTGIGYISFRPLSLDFKDFSFALGVSYLGRYIEVEDVNKTRARGTAVVDAQEVGLEAYQHAMNFSLLGSFPAAGFQFILDIGHGNSYLREQIGSINITQGAVQLTYEQYQYKQYDEGVFVSLVLLKSFDRDYFDFVNIFLYGGFRTRTTLRKSNAYLKSSAGPFSANSGRNDLPYVDALGIPFADPQTPDEFKINIINASGTLRLFTIFSDNSLFPGRGISFSVYGATSHVTGELLGENYHGIRMKLGGGVTIFNGINIRVNQVWESGNDQNNGFEVAVNIRVSGIVRSIANSM